MYLEAVDAEVLVRTAGGIIAVGVDSLHDSIQFMSSQSAWGHLFPDSGISEMEIGQSDLGDKHTWILVSVNASYDPHGPRNHWIPGFHKDQLTKDDYWDLSVIELKETKEQFRDAKTKLQHLREALEAQELLGDRCDQDGKEILKTQVIDVEAEVTKLLGNRLHRYTPIYTQNIPKSSK